MALCYFKKKIEIGCISLDVIMLMMQWHMPATFMEQTWKHDALECSWPGTQKCNLERGGGEIRREIGHRVSQLSGSTSVTPVHLSHSCPQVATSPWENHLSLDKERSKSAFIKVHMGVVGQSGGGGGCRWRGEVNYIHLWAGTSAVQPWKCHVWRAHGD